MLAARNGHDLERAVADIRHAGGRAIHVVADVADPQRVDAIADAAIREFGRIDTWVNNAAVSMYGRVMQLPIEDMRRQMDVNYWGQVYGSRAAVRHLRDRGGALINVASALADRAIPLQANYSAAKHALKAFTDGLRMELEEEGLPISVTLVKPASVDTPFFQKAKTYLGVEPQPVPPVYAPEVVAEVILHAAQHPAPRADCRRLRREDRAPPGSRPASPTCTWSAGRSTRRAPPRPSTGAPTTCTSRWPTTAASAAATGPDTHGTAVSTPRRSCIRERPRPRRWSD